MIIRLPKLVLMTLFSALLSTCSETEQAADPTSLAAEDSGLSTSEVALVSSNPFFSKSQLYLNYPPFDQIENAHFLPAFLRGMAEQSAEIEAIARQGEPATFVNTIIAMELSGQLLNRTDSVFSAMSSAHTNDEIRALEQQLAPQLAAHDDSIMLNRDLFARISRLYEQREALALDAQSKRLLGEYYSDFVRAGAALSVDQQQRMKELNGQIATLQTRYSQQILSEMNELAILVDSREELTGLDEALVAAAEAEADERGLQGKFLIPLLNTSGQPALASLQNRAVRETMHRTSLSRGNRGGEFDNRELLVDILRLRAERAQLLGFENHAHYILEDRTAQTVAAVNERLAELAPPAVANARREAADLQQMIYDEGADFELAAWDWDFYTEKVRAARYEFDASQLRPYFELNNVLQRGVFFAAEKLYGISFKERTDLPLYQEDVRVFEVFDTVGTTLALFIADYYARPSKRGGAWNTSYILQSNLMNTQAIMANHLNITEPIGNEATLLSFDEVNTLFHEFGHALHVMFSNVEYPYFSGTRVPRDFVEYPSQVNEMWATWPEVLANYAIHYQTGQPMPDELLDKVLSSQKFNQGFATTEYLSASILDQALHQLAPDKVPDADQLMQFESEVLETAGVAMPEIPPRYRSTYFNHIMGGYSAGYYSYIWSEVLDADSVEWFKENGGLRRQNGDHFRRTLLSRGASEDAMVLFRNFRGRDADIAPLLERRGLN